MRTRRPSALATGLLLVIPALATTASNTREKPDAAIPFRTAGRTLVAVEGSIGQLNGLTMLIDTGTSVSVVDSTVARRLNLRGTADRINAFGTERSIERLIVPFVRFGPIYAPDLPVITADLHRLEGGLGMRLDAIIGLDVLRGRCFVIDYLVRTLTFVCDRDFQRTIDFDRRSAHLLINVVVEGQPRRLAMDSGSDAIVLFERAVPPGPGITHSSSVQASLVSGPAQLRRFTANRVSVGDHDLGQRPVFVMRNPAEDVGYDGLFGARWLASRVMFDLERMVLGWDSATNARGR
jgi:hypothetical protein